MPINMFDGDIYIHIFFFGNVIKSSTQKQLTFLKIPTQNPAIFFTNQCTQKDTIFVPF